MQHHATAYSANHLSEVVLPEGIDVHHIDTDLIECERFSIDDVRELRRVSAQRPVTNSKRIFIIVCKILPTESQNALLKLLEDPPEATEFHIVLPTIAVLLPTLRSRMQLIGSSDKVSSNEIFDTFYGLHYAARMELIATLTKSKDSESIQAIFTGAAYYAHIHLQENPPLVEKILNYTSLVAAAGASKKMLLEDLALSLPLVK